MIVKEPSGDRAKLKLEGEPENKSAKEPET